MASLLLLILIQTIWSSTYVAMKLAMATMPVGLVLIFRYGIAVAALALLGQFRGLRFSRRDWAIAIAVGLLNFSLSPYLQLISLTMTRASDVAVIIALEPMATAMLAALVLRERLGRSTIATFCLATIGVCIMSGFQWDGTSLFGPERLLGNALFFGSLLCEAVYTVTGRRFSQRYDPVRLGAICLAAGAIGNLAANWALLTPEHLAAVSLTAWGAVLYLGLAASAFAYSVWVWLMKRLPVNRVTLSLFLQPVIGGVFGYFVLHESLQWRSLLGAGITLASLGVWLWARARSRRNAARRTPAPAPHRPIMLGKHSPTH